MTSRKPFTLLGAAAVPLAALGVAGCGGGGGATAAVTPPKPAAKHAVTTVRVANNSKLGKILVDPRGHTLYLFTKDTKTKSACSGACATAWPPLRANGKVNAASGVKASKLRTIKRSDGKSQVTYNGHPLYGFVMDKKAGDTKGQGLNAFGGLWFAISPAGKQVSAKKSGGSASHPAAPKPAPAPTAPKPAPAKPAPKPAPPSNNGIPQNNGGDQDSDNNGGPSDGDGAI